MHYIFLLFLMSVIGLSECKDITAQQWKKFKAEFNKTYESNQEDQKRFKIYKENIQNIQKHNKRYEQGKETYLQEINRFGDLTDEEFNDLYGLSENEYVKNYTDTVNRSLSEGDDDYLDWREAGAVTPAKDQGKCGSCWIFSAVGALESYNFRKTGKLVSLSEQNIVDCYSNTTCDGGMPYVAANYVQENGIYLESDYAYTAGQDQCRNLTKEPMKIDFNTTDYTLGSDEDLKHAVKKYGPISICLFVTANWRFYGSGVWYNKRCSPYSNHCVVVVGYGKENGNDYWLFKNSWGPNWGQNGYIKVARNKHEDYCGISYGMYIVDNEDNEDLAEEVDEDNFIDNDEITDI